MYMRDNSDTLAFIMLNVKNEKPPKLVEFYKKTTKNQRNSVYTEVTGMFVDLKCRPISPTTIRTCFEKLFAENFLFKFDPRYVAII